ncbi:MAG: hypothetical protein NTW08_09385 [Gammaproteobacteria bacterium]|nr:hypothetical protein [Gammaproteobacteria bacterium]
MLSFSLIIPHKLLFMRIVLPLLFLCYSLTALASHPSCDPIAIHDAISLKTAHPVFILFHNTAAHTVFIAHQEESSDSSAWSSRIEPGKWSVLSFDQKKLLLNCVESYPGHEQLSPCQTLLNVCQLKMTTPHEPGVIWLSENTSQPQLPQETQSVVH